MSLNARKGACFIVLLSAISSTNIALAATQPLLINNFAEEIFSSMVVSLSVGPAWESAGQNQTFFLQPGVQKTYLADKNTNTLAAGELFVGIERQLHSNFQGQLGIALATTSSAQLSGNVLDDADPAFNNFTYHYRVQHSHVAVKGLLLTTLESYAVKPYVSASLGVGFNRSYDFNNKPLLFEAVPSANFASNTETALTYTIGIGIQKVLKEHWQAGIGYEFADWGQSQLAKAPGQTTNDVLSLNHLYTNSVLFNLTWTA